LWRFSCAASAFNLSVVIFVNLETCFFLLLVFQPFPESKTIKAPNALSNRLFRFSHINSTFMLYVMGL
jgi:hypothetical protein